MDAAGCSVRRESNDAWPQNKLKEIVDNEPAPLNYLITAFEDHLLKVFAEHKARAAKARRMPIR